MGQHSIKTRERDPAIRPKQSAHQLRMTRRGLMLRRAIRGVAVVVAVVVLSGGAFLLYAKHKIDAHGHACQYCVPVTQQAGAPPASFNVLVLGSDSRAVLSAADQAKFDPTKIDRTAGQRSDTIALVHVDPASGKAVLINIPRDLRVPTANGQGYQKINSFYSSGVPSMVLAVEKLTGLDVNHYVEVNFDSFRTITDALGGVNIRFSRRIVDPNSGLNQPAGCNLLTGDQALAFVRDRDSDSDFGRIARQQLFVKQMMAKVLTPGTLLNPIKVASLVNLGLGTVSHDSGLDLQAMTSLALKFHSFSSSNIDFRVLPSAADNTPINGQLYVLENTAQANALFTALRNGDPLPDYGKQGGPSASPAPSSSPGASSGSNGTNSPSGPTLAPSTVPVVVLNGTPTAGLAHTVANTLAAKGFPVRTTHNADTTTYVQTVVYYLPGHQAAATSLQQSQFPGAGVEPLPAALATLLTSLRVGSTSAVVVLGPNATQAGGSAGLGGSAQTSPSPSPSPSPSVDLQPAGPATPIASQSFASAC